MCFFGFMVEEDGSIHLWQINWRKTNLTLKLKQICSCGMIIKDSNDNRWNGPRFILKTETEWPHVKIKEGPESEPLKGRHSKFLKHSFVSDKGLNIPGRTKSC